MFREMRGWGHRWAHGVPAPPLLAGNVLGINNNHIEAFASPPAEDPAFKKKVQEKGCWAQGDSACKRLQRN